MITAGSIVSPVVLSYGLQTISRPLIIGCRVRPRQVITQATVHLLHVQTNNTSEILENLKDNNIKNKLQRPVEACMLCNVSNKICRDSKVRLARSLVTGN